MNKQFNQNDEVVSLMPQKILRKKILMPTISKIMKIKKNSLKKKKSKVMIAMKGWKRS